jgi:chromosome segregation ATPase
MQGIWQGNMQGEFALMKINQGGKGMAKEQISGKEKLHRLSVSLDAAQLQHNTVLRRIEELKKEIEGNIVHNELFGYRSSTIARCRKEIKELTDEAENLSVSIAAMQRQLPILRREADIEAFHESVVTLKREVAEKVIASVHELLSKFNDVSACELLGRISSLSDEVGVFRGKLKDAFSVATQLGLPITEIQEIENVFRENISPLLAKLEALSDEVKDAIFELRYVFSH